MNEYNKYPHQSAGLGGFDYRKSANGDPFGGALGKKNEFHLNTRYNPTTHTYPREELHGKPANAFVGREHRERTADPVYSWSVLPGLDCKIGSKRHPPERLTVPKPQPNGLDLGAQPVRQHGERNPINMALQQYIDPHVEKRKKDSHNVDLKEATYAAYHPRSQQPYQSVPFDVTRWTHNGPPDKPAPPVSREVVGGIGGYTFKDVAGAEMRKCIEFIPDKETRDWFPVQATEAMKKTNQKERGGGSMQKMMRRGFVNDGGDVWHGATSGVQPPNPTTSGGADREGVLMKSTLVRNLLVRETAGEKDARQLKELKVKQAASANRKKPTAAMMSPRGAAMRDRGQRAMQEQPM